MGLLLIALVVRVAFTTTHLNVLGQGSINSGGLPLLALTKKEIRPRSSGAALGSTSRTRSGQREDHPR